MGDVVRSVRVVFDSSGVVRSLSSQDTAAKSSAASIKALADENARAIAGYDKIRATLDPAAASQLKYSTTARTLDDALRRGIATQAEHSALIDAAKAKYLSAGGEVTKFGQLIDQMGKFTHTAGGEISALGGKLDSIQGQISGVSGALEGLGTGGAIALGALLGVVISLAAGFEALSVLKTIIADGIKTQEVYDGLEASLRANGAAAGYSSAELIKLAEAKVNVTGRAKDEIVAGEKVLTQYQRLGHDVYPLALQAALDYAQQTSKAIPEAAKIIGEAYDGNIRGLTKLKDAGVTLAPIQRKTLQDMIDNGKITEYQSELTKILSGHLEGIAAIYAGGLGGSINIAREKSKLFTEHIASEVIPVLQAALKSTVDAAGGWDKWGERAKSAGDTVGNTIRYALAGVVVAINGTLSFINKFAVEVDIAFKTVDDSILSGVEFILRGLSKLPDALGGGVGGIYSKARQSVDDFRVKNNAALDDDIAKGRQAAAEHSRATDLFLQDVAKHNKALEGNDQVNNKHGRAEDEVAAKIKGHGAALVALQAIIDAYNNKLSDIITKENQALSKESALAQAAGISTAAYIQEAQAQERQALVNSKLNELRTASREEIQKLTEARDKARAADKPDPGVAAQAQADLDAALAGYAAQEKAVKSLASQTYDATIAKRDGLAVDKTYDQLVAQTAADEARLTDAFTGNTSASTRNAIQAELTRIKVELGKASVDDLSKSLVDNVTRLHEQAQAFKDLEPAVKAITDLEHNVQFDIAVSKIDTSVSLGIQSVEQKYLVMLQTMGQGSIDRGSVVLQALADKFGITLEDLITRIKGDLSKAEEIQFSAQFRGLGQSDLAKFTDEISRIKQAMADGVLSVTDGAAAIAKKTDDFWNSELGLWSSGLSYIAQHTGSFFRELADFVNKLQGAKGFGDNVGSLASSFGAGSGASAGLGTAAFEIGIVLAIVDTVEGIWAKHNLKKLGNYAQLIISDTDEGVTALDKNGIAAVAAIRKTVGEFASALGGMVGSIEAVGIRVRNDGKAVAAYVAGQFIGYFADIDSAVRAALLNELQSGKALLKNLPPLVAQGLTSLHLGTGEGLDDLLAFEEKLKEISQLTFSQGAIQVTDTISKMNELWATLAKMTTATTEVDQGFVDIGNTIVNSFASWRRSITGDAESPAELLAAKQAEAKLFNAQKALEIARLEMEKFDLQSQGEYLKGKSAGYQGDAELSKGDLHNKKAYLEAKQAIITTDATLTSEAIKIVNAQINAIDDEINALKNIPDIDLSKIKIPTTGKAGISGDPLQEVRDALERERISQLGQEGQALANITAKYDDLNKKAGKHTDLLAQLAKAEQAEIDALSKQASAQYLTPYLGGQFSGDRTDYAKQLRDAADAEADLTANASKFKFSIADISDAFREQSRELGLQALSDLGDSTASITLQYEKTGQAIDFLKSHMVDLSLTADQVASALSQISGRTELSIFSGVQQYITDQTTLNKYKEVQYELDIADAKTKLALAYESNAITLEAYNRLGTILYGLPETEPASLINGAKSVAQTQFTAANTQLQAAQTANDAADKLTQWQHSLLTNPDTSPLAPRAQVAQSKADLDAVITKALSGDSTARDKFTTYADDYLKLFSSTFGKTGAYAAEALNLEQVADKLKTSLINNPAQSIALFPGYSAGGGGALPYDITGLGSGAKPGGNVPPPPITNDPRRVPTPADPKLIDRIGTVADRLGPDGDLLKTIRATGIDSARYHSIALQNQSAQLSNLQGINTNIATLSSYLQRVIESMRTRTGTDG